MSAVVKTILTLKVIPTYLFLIILTTIHLHLNVPINLTITKLLYVMFTIYLFKNKKNISCK